MHMLLHSHLQKQQVKRFLCKHPNKHVNHKYYVSAGAYTHEHTRLCEIPPMGQIMQVYIGTTTTTTTTTATATKTSPPPPPPPPSTQTYKHYTLNDPKACAVRVTVVHLRLIHPLLLATSAASSNGRWRVAGFQV